MERGISNCGDQVGTLTVRNKKNDEIQGTKNASSDMVLLSPVSRLLCVLLAPLKTSPKVSQFAGIPMGNGICAFP